MTYTAADLTGKSLEELRTIAKQLNINPHHNAKAETIAYQIMQQPQSALKAAMDPMEHKAAQPQAPVIVNTVESIRAAISEFLKKEGFVADFPGDDTWIFRYKGAEDSGNISIPLRVIKQRATIVARGAARLKSMGRDNTYPGSYTDNILMG